jgi:predicted nucleic acid-binding protein
MSKNYRIYLDVCCLNRPFDDQSQLRIRLETESILTIIYQCQQQQWKLIRSCVLDWELTQIRDFDKLKNIQKILTMAKIKVVDSPSLQKRANELQALGFSSYDAAHIASAERSQADIFLTTDDRLIKRAKRLTNLIKVNIDNPVQWLVKMIQEEESNDENAT